MAFPKPHPPYIPVSAMELSNLKSGGSSLNPQQELFVLQYVLDFNATRAARDSGYGQGATSYSASSSGRYLLKQPAIRAAIRKELDTLGDTLKDRAHRVIEELTRIAFSDVRELFDEEGYLHNPTAIPDHIAPAIAGIEVLRKKKTETSNDDQSITTSIEENIHKIRLYDKAKALELLGRYLGVLHNTLEVTGPGGGPIQVQPVVDVGSLPTWLKQVLVIVVKGGTISSDLESRLTKEVGDKFIEMIGSSSMPKREEIRAIGSGSTEPPSFEKGSGCGPFEERIDSLS